jgi:hypothetical protein
MWRSVVLYISTQRCRQCVPAKHWYPFTNQTSHLKSPYYWHSPQRDPLVSLSHSLAGRQPFTTYRALQPCCNTAYLPAANREPITVPARCRAWTLFVRLNTEIVVSKPTRGIDVCVRVYSALVSSSGQVAALRRTDPPSKVSYRPCKKIKKLKKPPRSNKGLYSHR